MPLLRRKPLVRFEEPLKENDEVFVCATTGELFSKYDDYFNRTIMLTSTVWSCEMTGRGNLTYKCALESERSAKRTLKAFSAVLKGPILLIASRTKHTSIHDLAGDVHSYVKDVFFTGEIVHTKTGDPETVRKAKIVRVASNGSQNDHSLSRLIYHVESCGGGTPACYSVQREAIIRERNSFSREKCKMFLKQHVEPGTNQMLCVKETSLEQFVTSKGWTDDNVFYGQMPDFKVSKKIQIQEHTQKPGSNSKIAARKRTKLSDKENKQKESDNKIDSVAKKKSIIEQKKDRREERAAQKFLAKQRMLVEKSLLLPLVAVAQKEYSAIKEDLELTDQRVIPPAREVRTFIGEENFSDFLFILEFLNAFGDLLSIESKFPDGVTMKQLERALLLKEMNGPLSDIFQLLLNAIFTALKDINTSEEANLEPGTKRVFKWCNKHFSTNLTELPMEPTTISELLRLHIVAYNQPTYFGDACFILIRDHPHILQSLTRQTVFQLSTENVIQIICALIHQLLVTEEVLSRVENVGEARMKLKNIQQEKRRLTHETSALKLVVHDDMKKQLACYEADNKFDEYRKELEQKLNDDLEHIENRASAKMKELQNELEALKQSCSLYQVHLGSDRGFRNYWQFRSLPGLFVEHDTRSNGRCLERVTSNIPGLALCEPTMRKKYISDSILKCAGNSNDLLEMDANGDLLNGGEVYKQLLLRGSTLLEHSKKREKNTNANASISCSTVDVAAVSKMETNVSVTQPTNHELFMCTGDEANCPIHTSNHGTITKWGYYATREELDALINSLNQRGTREHSLRKSLILYRDSIESRIELCPIASLSIQDNEYRKTLAANNLIPQDKNHESQVMPQDELLETMLRESLLEFEVRVTVGCLGRLQVNSIEKWRDAILHRSYDSQIDGQLQWGQNRSRKKFIYVKKANQESSSEESEEEQLDNFELCKEDPGYDLPKLTNNYGSVQEQDGSKARQETIRSLASALLQIEQGIDIKFFRHPLGPKGTCKDPNTILWWQHKVQNRLIRWEASLMRATSFSQLFVHYHVLYDAIRWSRSIERIVCMVCRLKGDASVTLLCDECNRACHMHCLKPKLKKIPEGDWFCMQCRAKDHEPKIKNSAKGRKLPQRAKYNDSDADERDSQDEVENNDGGNESGSTYEELSKVESSSNTEEYESDNEEDMLTEDPEEIFPKIVIHKKNEMKKVNTMRTVSNGGIVQNHSLQRPLPNKRIQQTESTQERKAKKMKLSEFTGKRSLDVKIEKISSSRSAPRALRNQDREIVQKHTLRRSHETKRSQETQSNETGHIKTRKSSENFNHSNAGRRSARLSLKGV